jgi:hypothetical protein
MLRYLFLTLLAVFTFTAAFAQAYEKAVFVNKETKTEVTFKKGQKVKVVWQNAEGITYKYQGWLIKVSPDTISLDRKKKLGEVALPLSGVVKIQRVGIPPFGWVFIVVGVLLMGIGLAYVATAEIGFTSGPLGVPVQQQSTSKTPGWILCGLGFSWFLSGLLFFKYPPVNQPNEKWEMRIETPHFEHNSPKIP